MIDIEDFKLALAGWYMELDSESGNYDAFECEPLKKLMEKYSLTRADIYAAIPAEWTC